MKPKLFLITAAVILALGLTSVRSGAIVGLPVYEIPLNSNGSAFEVNRDTQGRLWVSDYLAGEIWALDPVSQGYTRYTGLDYPSDARSDDSGSVWFTDVTYPYLGQLAQTTGALTWWLADGSEGLYATAIDSDGNVWATSGTYPLVYGFNPTTRKMCSYALPVTMPSQYIVANDEGIWLADYNGGSIFRLEPDPDPAQNQFTIWQLPASSWPVGLDLDVNGDLWWADYDLGSLHQLETDLPGDADLMTTYELPITEGSPVMLDASTGRIRFSDDVTGATGSLDPATAGVTGDLTPTTQPVTPTCDTIDPLTGSQTVMTNGMMEFTPNMYANLADSAGWKIWQVPDLGAPYGVRASENSVWTADYERQVLIWEFSGSVVSVCKRVDRDGNLTTTNDQTPLKNWRVYLKVDGVRQEPGQLTTATGCYTWLDLDSGQTYAVEEEVPEGWEALTPSEVVLGPGAEGQLYQATFINKASESNFYLPMIIR